MSFKISGLDPQQFRTFYSLSDAELAAMGILRVVADAKPGFPCRVTLRDAEIGETLLLLNYEHLPVESPYRSAHAIFVIQGADEPYDRVDEVPGVLRRRLLSVRAFDERGMMMDADVLDGMELENAIPRFFAQTSVAYLHVHNAKRGCFAARVDRAR